MSKGSKRRPMLVKRDKYSKAWDRTFEKKQEEKQDTKEQEAPKNAWIK